MRKRVFIGLGLTVLLICSARTLAMPYILAEWAAHYPTSTLPSRMAHMAGDQCFTCHHPQIGSIGNCYRMDLKALLNQGVPVSDAIDQLDSVDSDGDGVPNGEEILMVRVDLPAEVGYNMGLIGDLGTDPCAADPGEIVTGVPETPPSAPVGADCDGDGVFILNRDLPCFINVLLEINTDPGAIDRSDVNRDGQTNGIDIEGFITCAIAGC